MGSHASQTGNIHFNAYILGSAVVRYFMSVAAIYVCVIMCLCVRWVTETGGVQQLKNEHSDCVIYVLELVIRVRIHDSHSEEDKHVMGEKTKQVRYMKQ